MKNMKSQMIFFLCLFFLIISAVTVFAKEKTISGAVTSIEAGDGFENTTITINLGSNSNLRKDDVGWVTKDGEAIAYIKIISVSSNSSVAVVTRNTTIKEVSSGLPVYFKVDVPEPKPEPKPDTKTEPKKGPGGVTRITSISLNYGAHGYLSGSGESLTLKIYKDNNPAELSFWTSRDEGETNHPIFGVKIRSSDGTTELGDFRFTGGEANALRLKFSGGGYYYLTIYSIDGSGSWSIGKALGTASGTGIVQYYE